MRTEDLILVSIDDHVVEPADMFDRHVPDKYRGQAPESVLAEFNDAGVTDDEMHKITWQNTARFFDYDPFRHISKSDASVGALRALSPDVDTTTRPKSEWRQMFEAAAEPAR